MLEVSTLSAHYEAHPALQEVSLTVSTGEIVVILGANGAGKSTLLRCIAGICEGKVSGQIRVNGGSISGLPSDQIVEEGIALVPEGRGIFADLTVKENLLLGAHAKRARATEASHLQRVLTLFPRLAERQSQAVRTMSGGEQQMVAIGRALMSNPDILLLDEPSLGLSPLLCKDLFRSLREVRDTGIGILLVEQNARQSLAIADRGYLLENTRVIHEDTASKLMNDSAVQKAYLGAAADAPSSIDDSKSESDQDNESLTQASAFKRIEPPRQSAEQLLGYSIQDLVESASSQTAQYSYSALKQSAQYSSSTSSQTVQRSTSSSSQTVQRSTSSSNQTVQHSISSSNQAAQHKSSAVETAPKSASSTYTDAQASPLQPIPTSEASHQARLEVTMRAIELAAQKASQRTHTQPLTSANKDLTGEPIVPNQKHNERLVVIEIYRPPRVEVYRRRPGKTQLERE